MKITVYFFRLFDKMFTSTRDNSLKPSNTNLQLNRDNYHEMLPRNYKERS
ncbi:hypothetical protein VPHK460_0134 [Vibrio phage K460]